MCMSKGKEIMDYNVYVHACICVNPRTNISWTSGQLNLFDFLTLAPQKTKSMPL